MGTRRGEILYDVFLSFRGEDTRRNFTSHLYSALSKAGIQTFIDDETLERGEEISKSLLEAIEMSRSSIIIISPNYAGSKWCLDELVKILECRQTMDHWTVPVFYQGNPLDVRYRTGRFGELFEDLMRNRLVTKETARIYRKSLTVIANTAGFVAGNFKNEAKLIEDIVERVTRRINSTNLFVADYPVGIGLLVREVILKLKSNAGSNNVLILGLWGMGGIGKTTVAKAIFNALSWQFQRRSFIENIREVWRFHGRQGLQEQLLYDILGETTIKIHSIGRGKEILRRRLRDIRALVLLDDVDNQDQLKALCGDRNWFAPSSIIIITTRDMSIFGYLQPNYIHKMKEMEHAKSLELFSWHAFRRSSPTNDFTELSNDVVAYCGGLPLALEVLGSFLFNKRAIEEWKDLLSKLQKIPDGEVHEKLKISFDGLKDPMYQDIFLDICCFFIGKNKTYVSAILGDCGQNAKIGISVLTERSLLRVNRNNKLEMHDLLRDMGREIICEKSQRKVEERSRLWFHEDALNVLRKKMGTIHVEGLALKLPGTNTICLPTEAFKQMKKLRLLQLSHVELAGNYNEVLEDLRWICWLEFPWDCPPRNFYKRSLVAIDFRCSKLKVFWKVQQFLPGLKILNLSHSHYLEKTPDFSFMPNLERLILKDCPSLSKVDKSIENLNKLLVLNFKGCKCLEHLPRSFYKLKNLRNMILSGSSIGNLEEDIEQMESLEIIAAENTPVTRVPFSIVRLKSIKYVSLLGYKGSSCDVFPSLIWSWMPPLNISRYLTQAFGSTSSQVSSSMGDATNYLLSKPTQRTALISSKDDLALAISHNQADMPRLEDSMISLLIGMGEQNILQDWTVDQSKGSSFPFDGPRYSNEGQGVCFEVPYVDCSLEGMILCIDYSCSQHNMASPFPFSIHIQNNTKGITKHYIKDSITNSDDKNQWRDIASILVPGDEIEVIVVFGLRFAVKKTTLHLVYGQSVDKKMEGLSTSNKDVAPTNASSACKKPTKVNPKRVYLDDDDEEEEEESTPLK